MISKILILDGLFNFKSCMVYQILTLTEIIDIPTQPICHRVASRMGKKNSNMPVVQHGH